MDERIVVVDKPVGVVTAAVPMLLREQLHTDCFRTVHRLDAQVGGLLVLARSVKAASLLGEQLSQHRFTKEYLAVVHGTTPHNGEMTDLLGRDRQNGVTYVAACEGKDVRPARLSYETIAQRDALSFVRVQLHTGRTHQIRVQFSSRGYPLWGDRKYGTAQETSMALYCCRLGFAHPQTGEPMDFSRLPQGGIWDSFLKAGACPQIS